jgi:hypothetical protein
VDQGSYHSQYGSSVRPEKIVTHVANKDGLASFSSWAGKVGEWVGGGSGNTSVETSAWATTESTTKASPPCEAATESATANESSTATEATSKAAATKSTASKATRSTSKAILTNFKGTTLPVIAIELLNGIASIVRRFESNNTGTLWTTVGTNVDIGTNNSTVAS